MRASSCLLALASLVVVPGAVLGQSPDSVRSSLLTVEVQSGRIDTVFSERRHFEAPNWSRDGGFFVVNSAGRLYRLAAAGARGARRLA